MIADMDHVVSSLLGKDSLRDLEASELKHLALQYPYASFLHLLRSRKLKDGQDAEYPHSVALTALYINNPHWLHHQLQAVTTGSRVQEWEKAMSAPEEDEALDMPEIEDPDAVETSEVSDISQTSLIEEETVSPPRHPEAPEYLDEGTPPIPAEEPEQDHITGRLSDILKEANAPVVDTAVPIEPLYTIDYFASVGIRLPAEPEQGDQLGSKLKSFTEWLKDMRRLHPEKLEAQMDAGSETRIRKDAELSNDPAGVLTETMATVFLQQGLKEKAVEVYRKLSLLEPAKSGYFASKIDEIKALPL
jgi:hypothetical protein